MSALQTFRFKASFRELFAASVSLTLLFLGAVFFLQGEDFDGDGYDDDTGDYVGGEYDDGSGGYEYDYTSDSGEYDDTYDPSTGEEDYGYEFDYGPDSEFDDGTYGSSGDIDSDNDGLFDNDESMGYPVEIAYETSFLESVYDDSTGDYYEEEVFYVEYYTDWVYPDIHDPDSDGDLWPDGYEIDRGTNPMDPADGNRDVDRDGLTAGEEYELGTLELVADSDDDTHPDGIEVMVLFTDPMNRDDPPPPPGEDSSGPSTPPSDGGSTETSDPPTDPDPPGDDGTIPESDGGPGEGGEIDAEALAATLLWQRQNRIPTNIEGIMEQDSDGDGLLNFEERELGTHPRKSDTDGDGIFDRIETEGQAVSTYAYQSESAGNWQGPPEDAPADLGPPIFVSDPLSGDGDGDGYSDLWEWTHRTNPMDPNDLDPPSEWGGELPIEFAWQHPDLSAYGDEDGDDILNGEEFIYRTDPFSSDTDGDSISDSDEIRGYSILELSTDGYFAETTWLDYDPETGEEIQVVESYWVEAQYTPVMVYSDPTMADTDGDHLLDGFEAAHGYDPGVAEGQVIDEDGDGLDLGQEIAAGSSDFSADTDRDGLTDFQEVMELNPLMDALALDLFDPSNPADGMGDPDGDHLRTSQEYNIFGTNFLHYDSDLDGYFDNIEIFYQSDPLDPSDPTPVVSEESPEDSEDTGNGLVVEDEGDSETAEPEETAYFNSANSWSYASAGSGNGNGNGNGSGDPPRSKTHPESDSDTGVEPSIRTKRDWNALYRVGFVRNSGTGRKWYRQKVTETTNSGTGTEKSPEETTEGAGHTKIETKYSWNRVDTETARYPEGTYWIQEDPSGSTESAVPPGEYVSTLTFTTTRTETPHEGGPTKVITSFTGSNTHAGTRQTTGTMDVTTVHDGEEDTKTFPNETVVNGYSTGELGMPVRTLNPDDGSGIEVDTVATPILLEDATIGSDVSVETYSDAIPNKDFSDALFALDLKLGKWNATDAAPQYFGLPPEAAVAAMIGTEPPNAAGGHNGQGYISAQQYQVTLPKPDGKLYYWYEYIVVTDDPSKSTRILRTWKADTATSNVYDLGRTLIGSKTKGIHYATEPILLSVEFEDEELNSGLDDVTEPNWFMIPQDDTNRLYAVSGASQNSPIDFKSKPETSYSTPTPSRVTQPRELLEFEGRIEGDSEYLVAGVDPEYGDAELIKFHVRKQIPIRVVIHPITSIDGNGGKHEVAIEIDSQTIKDQLNEIFENQANLYVDTVDVKEPTEVYWDNGGNVDVFDDVPEWISDPESDGPSHFENMTNSGFLDVYSHDLLSPEEQTIVSSAFDENADFNIYIVASMQGYLPPDFPYPWENGRALQVWQGNFNNGKKFNNGEAYGWAGNPDGILWLSDIITQVGPIDWAIGHEMGHQIFDVPHTDGYWGRESYRDRPGKTTGDNMKPDFKRGLMNSNYIVEEISTLIVKWEAEQTTVYFKGSGL